MYTEIWLDTWDPTTTIYRHFSHLIWFIRHGLRFIT